MHSDTTAGERVRRSSTDEIEATGVIKLLQSSELMKTTPGKHSFKVKHTEGPNTRGGLTVEATLSRRESFSITRKLSATTASEVKLPEVRERTELQKKVGAFLLQTPVQILGFLFTIIALIGDDFIQLTMGKEVDYGFYVTLTLIFVFFCLEIVFNTFSHDMAYLKSQFFIFDLIGTLSLIPDIPWLSQGLISLFLSGSVTQGQDSETLTLAKAGRAAKVGSRTARLIRLVRVFRLMRVVRLAKFFKFFGHYDEARTGDAEGDDPDQNRPSAIGKRLAELVSRRVVLLIMVIILVTPNLQYENVDLTRIMHLNQLASIWNDTAAVNMTLTHIQSVDPYLIYLAMGNVSILNNLNSTPYVHRRPTEILTFGPCTSTGLCELSNPDLVAKYDIQRLLQEQSGYNLALTFFVTIVLVGASYSFSRDAHEVIVKPVERMTQVVRKVMTTLISLQQEVVQKDDKGSQQKKHENIGDDVYETEFLEGAITKMAALLKVGFGAAGTEIIAHNFSRGGDLNAMVPGTKVRALFSFVNIGSFKKIMTALGVDVLLFVNSFANLLHHFVEVSYGSPNKNLGNAFLLVWKLPNVDIHSENANYKNWVREEEAIVSTGALDAMTHVVNELRRVVLGSSLETSEPLVRQDLKTIRECIARIPKFELNVGIGMHIGWAIEGAIGSVSKIDASYLSPHVNLTARFGSATKQYGVCILFSEMMANVLPEKRIKLCRMLDRVTVKGSRIPISIYTNDISLERSSMWHAEHDDTQYRRKKSITGADVVKETGRRMTNTMMELKDNIIRRLKSTKRSNSVQPNTNTDHISARKSSQSSRMVRTKVTMSKTGSVRELPSLSKENRTKKMRKGSHSMQRLTLYKPKPKNSVLKSLNEASQASPHLSDRKVSIKVNNEEQASKRRRSTKRGSLMALAPDFRATRRLSLLGDPNTMQSNYRRLHSQGIQAYIAGDWEYACKQLLQCFTIRPSDQATSVILEFMHSNHNTPPADWEGYRPLKRK
eukprot:g543.t1